jgi:hypothetical protein
VVGGDGEDVVSGALELRKIRPEDDHLDVGEGIGFEVCGRSAVDVDFGAARSGEVKLGRSSRVIDVKMSAEIAGLIALLAGELLGILRPDVLLGEGLVEGGEEDGVGDIAGGIELRGGRHGGDGRRLGGCCAGREKQGKKSGKGQNGTEAGTAAHSGKLLQ